MKNIPIGALSLWAWTLMCLANASSIERTASSEINTESYHFAEDANTESSWMGGSPIQILAQLAVVVAVAAVCLKKDDSYTNKNVQSAPAPLMQNSSFGTLRDSGIVPPAPPPRASLRRGNEAPPMAPPRSRINSMVMDENIDLSSAKVSMATPGREFESWQLDLSYTKFVTSLSQGAFGSIYKAEYEDPNHKLVPVTIQKLDAYATTMEEDLRPRVLFISEASVLMEFRHPNILWLIGCQTTQSDWHLVTEHLEYGNLTVRAKTTVVGRRSRMHSGWSRARRLLPVPPDTEHGNI
eukprot:m.480966 g.480966  ORF g.480966 m.480966 type:complete len:296 (-) comp21713_c0_seq2:1768-2655(-)